MFFVISIFGLQKPTVSPPNYLLPPTTSKNIENGILYNKLAEQEKKIHNLRVDLAKESHNGDMQRFEIRELIDDKKTLQDELATEKQCKICYAHILGASLSCGHVFWNGLKLILNSSLFFL